jgi:hypothetical protein
MCFPAEDTAFADRVRALVTELIRSSATEAELLATVLDNLRRDYPEVRIRTRDPIAEYLPEEAAWFVYRDGRSHGDELRADHRADGREPSS